VTEVERIREEPMERDSSPDTRCGYLTWVGAYLLGALDPVDRSEFTVHIRTCGRCREEIVTLAELPGILARAYRTGAP
jgi:anti-sigma factor RsiW